MKEFEKVISANAITDFVNMMIGALEAGFVDKNNPTLSEIYQVARNHIKDTYGLDTPDIVEKWGEDIAKECGLGEDS